MLKTFSIPLTTVSSTPIIPHIIDFNEQPAVLICASSFSKTPASLSNTFPRCYCCWAEDLPLWCPLYKQQWCNGPLNENAAYHWAIMHYQIAGCIFPSHHLFCVSVNTEQRCCQWHIFAIVGKWQHEHQIMIWLKVINVSCKPQSSNSWAAVFKPWQQVGIITLLWKCPAMPVKPDNYISIFQKLCSICWHYCT